MNTQQRQINLLNTSHLLSLSLLGLSMCCSLIPDDLIKCAAWICLIALAYPALTEKFVFAIAKIRRPGR